MCVCARARATVPPQFMQLYTIHGLQNGRNAIGLYALLRNKDQGTYEHMLNHVSALTNRAVPQSINIADERGAIGAAEIVYPNSNKRRCFFHLSQNVYRHVQQNGLSQIHLRDEDFRTNIRKVSALAFVPREDIVARFEDLPQHCSPQEIPILDYFETNYVGELRRGLRRPPLFAHSLRNVHDRILLNLPRTTNALGQSHANMWKFIDALKREHAMANMSISQHQAGLPPPERENILKLTIA